MMVFIKIH